MSWVHVVAAWWSFAWRFLLYSVIASVLLGFCLGLASWIVDVDPRLPADLSLLAIVPASIYAFKQALEANDLGRTHPPIPKADKPHAFRTLLHGTASQARGVPLE